MSMSTLTKVDNMGYKDIKITRDSFRKHWKQARYKGVIYFRTPFFHYKSATRSNLISKLHFIFFHICAKSGFNIGTAGNSVKSSQILFDT